jgi:Ca2+-transporting ATPase
MESNLYGVAVLMTILASELSFMQRLLGLTSLSGSQWLTCIIAAILLLLVDEVVKFFMRRARRSSEKVEVVKPAPQPA